MKYLFNFIILGILTLGLINTTYAQKRTFTKKPAVKRTVPSVKPVKSTFDQTLSNKMAAVKLILPATEDTFKNAPERKIETATFLGENWILMEFMDGTRTAVPCQTSAFCGNPVALQAFFDVVAEFKSQSSTVFNDGNLSLNKNLIQKSIDRVSDIAKIDRTFLNDKFVAIAIDMHNLLDGYAGRIITVQVPMDLLLAGSLTGLFGIPSPSEIMEMAAVSIVFSPVIVVGGGPGDWEGNKNKEKERRFLIQLHVTNLVTQSPQINTLVEKFQLGTITIQQFKVEMRYIQLRQIRR